MNKFKRLISLAFVCVTLTTASYANAETVTVNEEIRNTTAQIYEGKVRINTLMFDNEKVKEPILLYQGSYYLPLTPQVLENLGVTTAMTSNGTLELLLDIPQVAASPSDLANYENDSSRVSILVYQKNISVNGIVINPQEAFHPVLVYNNTFYLPLTNEIISEGLEISIKFSDEKVLTLHRDIDKMIMGTVLSFPQQSQREFLENTERALLDLKDKLIKEGEHYVLEGQEQYVIDSEEGEDVYVVFDDSSWLVARQPREGKGTALNYFAENGDHYVGEYLDGSFSGIGRYIDVDGNVTAIKPFEHEQKEIAYLERPVNYSEYMPVLALLIDFSDESITGSDETWFKKLFAEESNSLRGYYKEVMNERLKLIPALEMDRIINDGIVRLKLDIPHPDTGKEIPDTRQLMKHIAEALEDKVDLSLYDKNDNGVLDQDELAIIAILAGYESSTTTPDEYAQFRAHHLFSDISLAVADNIGLMNMIYISEKEYFSGSSALSTMAVFAHELGHQLGLPDLYDIDGSSKGLGPFSLMAEGTGNYSRGQRPGEVIARFDPWSLIQLGAVTPQVVSSSGEFELRSSSTGDYNIIRINTQNESEYFLLENRRVEERDLGLRDSLKQSGGIMIYHIDDSIINSHYNDNSINSNELKKGIDVEEASERTTGALLDNDQYLERIAPFFSAKGQSVFGPTGLPKSRLNDSSDSGITVEVLSDGPTSKVRITIDN